MVNIATKAWDLLTKCQTSRVVILCEVVAAKRDYNHPESWLKTISLKQNWAPSIGHLYHCRGFMDGIGQGGPWVCNFFLFVKISFYF